MPVATPEWDYAELPRRYWTHSGVPQLHVEGLRRIAEPDDADERAAKWWRALIAVGKALDSNGIVALLGNRGCGKTQIASKIIQDNCLRRRVPSIYRRLGDVYGDIRAAYNIRGLSEASILDRLARYGLLVLDECHERAGSDFEARTLARLIDSRYTVMKPTLLISNEMPDAFTESMGPSVADRLRENGKVIVCRWTSFREPQDSVIGMIE